MQLTSNSISRGFQLTTLIGGLPSGINGGQSVALGPLGSCVAGDGSILVADHFTSSIYKFPDQDNQLPSQFLVQTATPTPPRSLLRLGDYNYVTLAGASGGVYQVSDDGIIIRSLSGPVGGLGWLGLVGRSGANPILYGSGEAGGIYSMRLLSGSPLLITSAYGSGGGTVSGYDVGTGALTYNWSIPGHSDGVAVGYGSLVNKLYANTNEGSIYEVDLTSSGSAAIMIASGGTRGDFIGYGSNGTLMVSQTADLLRLIPPAGGSFIPVSIPESFTPSTGPALKFAKRIPRGTGTVSRTVPIAYIEIPQPDPSASASIIDVSAGTVEDVSSRKVSFPFTGQLGAVSIYRNASGSTYGPITDPSTAQNGYFVIPNTGNTTAQDAATSPIHLTKIEQDETGAWYPLLSRGLFYRVIKMADGRGSWLSTAGFQPGQYLLASYTTEFDWRLLGGSATHRGSSFSGSGQRLYVRHEAPIANSAYQVTLNPESLKMGGQILGIGGLTTSNGTELLTEAGSGTVVPGDGTGTLGSLTAEVFQASYGGITQGALRTSLPIRSTLISSATLIASIDNASLYTAVTGNSAPDPTTIVYRFSGSFFVAKEGYYNFTTTSTGKSRVFHWGIPIIDRWYGPIRSADNTTHTTTCQLYLHAGWHDLSVELAPQNNSSGSVGSFGFSITGVQTIVFCSAPTTKSQVAAINVTSSLVTLKNGFVGATTEESTSLLASYAYADQTLPYRGFYDNNGVWQQLDLNPGSGRFYGSKFSSTSDWLENTCVVWAIPSMICALTSAIGIPIPVASRNWVSCGTYVKSTLQWGSINGQTSLSSSIGAAPFGTSSSFGSEDLGVAQYSAIGASQGLYNGTLTDPRGIYKSGFILGQVTVSNGLPSVSSLRCFDVRVRGGGVSHEVQPEKLPLGGARERASTHWDLSSWEGNEDSPAGTALIQIPQSYLTGADGGPSWTPQEVEALVRQTLAAGIKPLIQYV